MTLKYVKKIKGVANKNRLKNVTCKQCFNTPSQTLPPPPHAKVISSRWHLKHTSGESKGSVEGGPGPNFIFIQFLGTIGQIVCWRPLRTSSGVGSPPLRNPESATAYLHLSGKDNAVIIRRVHSK